MGCRYLICVFYQGRWWLAQYGQWAGDYSIQGVKIFRFLSVAANIERLKAGLPHVYHPEEEELNAMQVEIDAWERERREANDTKNQHQGMNKLYSSLSRDTGAKILGLIANATAEKRVPSHMSLDFLTDRYHICEWTYVIDLDAEVFEIYGKDWEQKHDGHRFRVVEPEDGMVPKLGCALPFSELFMIVHDRDFVRKVGSQLYGEAGDEYEIEEYEDEEDEEGEDGDEDEEGGEIHGSGAGEDMLTSIKDGETHKGEDTTKDGKTAKEGDVVKDEEPLKEGEALKEGGTPK